MDNTIARLEARERRVRGQEDERDVRAIFGWYAYYTEGRDEAVAATGYDVPLHETPNVASMVCNGGNRWPLRRVDGRCPMSEPRHRWVRGADFASNLTHTRTTNPDLREG